MSSLMYNNSSLSIHSDDFRKELIRYMMNVNYIISFVQIFICLTGVFGNLLALIVINRKSLRNTSSAVFITYMAIFYSTVLLLHAGVLLSHTVKLATPLGNLFLHCSLTYLIDISTLCATWILVIITLERCVAVYSPFLAKRFCTVHSARYSMYILLTVSVIFLSGIFPIIYQKSEPPKTLKCLVRPNRGLFLRIYQLILFYAIPDLLLLSNLFTVYALCRRRQRLSSTYLNNKEDVEIRVNDVNSNRKQRQLTIMLVTVSLSFYLFTTPAMILHLTEHQRPKDQQLDKRKRYFLISQISVILSQLNNATNFIFYCFTGQRFRHATMQTFHYYSRRLITFYHRYILGDKQYNLISMHRNRFNSLGNTTIITRSSVSPHHHQHQYRTSTM